MTFLFEFLPQLARPETAGCPRGKLWLKRTHLDFSTWDNKRSGLMKKLAYLECPTGLAGDMCLGALIHAGVPLDYLIEKLSLLGLEDEYQLQVESVHRNGQQATKVHVHLGAGSTPQIGEPDSNPTFGEAHQVQHHPHANQSTQPDAEATRHGHDIPSRHLPDIETLITRADLPPQAKAWSLAVFRQLAAAEGAVHGIAPEQVHFHEVGAIDAIVDIVGTCLGFDWLEIDELYCSALPTGGGTIRASHGRMPVPTPAVLKLLELRQVPVYHNGIDRELVTPTGAAIATTLAQAFGPPPPMTLHQLGLGAGSLHLPLPNIVRLWVGESRGQAPQSSIQARSDGSLGDMTALETIAVLETQIDDLNPQAIGYIFEALFLTGALDVFTQAVGMKKSRPGTLLTVICYPGAIAACEQVLFQETTTLGIRRSLQERAALPREIRSVQTDYGKVRVKVAWSEEGEERAIANVQPEYEDCARIARQHRLPWRSVHQMVLNTWFCQATTERESNC